MAIPVYLWLKDDGGADIKGSVDVAEREGSIEVVALGHQVSLPTDDITGKVTDTREHFAFNFDKQIDSSTPYLYKALTTARRSNQPNSDFTELIILEEKSNISEYCLRASRW